MSKTKSSEIPHYEVLFVVPNKFTQEEADAINKKVKDIISKNKGNITFSEEWGKKRLAYSINHFNHGYYYLAEFDMEGESLTEVNKILRMSNEVLRHQIVRKKVKTAEEIAKEKKVAEKIATKTEVKTKEEEEKAKTKDAKKLDLKDLDKKLDKILDTDDLL